MRKYLVALLSLSLVLLGFLMNLLMPRHCPVSLAACERVVQGMTQAEVHAILGGPPGDYRTRPSGLPLNCWEGLEREDWHGDEGTVTVRYSKDHDAVVSVEFTAAEPYDANPLELVRWRMEKLWSKLVS
jgi:hypothetical protein